MMVDMLGYGAAAQVNFSYGTDDLANSQLTAAQKGYGTTTVTTLKNNQGKGTNYLGTRLVLESSIQLQVAFKNLTADKYVIYSFTNHLGEVQTVRVDSADFVDAGGVYGVELSELVYADARQQAQVTVYNADGSVYGTASDSIEGYIQRNTKGDDVFAALMKFADAAYNYFH